MWIKSQDSWALIKANRIALMYTTQELDTVYIMNHYADDDRDLLGEYPLARGLDILTEIQDYINNETSTVYEMPEE